MQEHKFETPEAAMSFIQGGKATFTIRSKKTEARFTYKVSESDDGRCMFVGLLNGPDNERSYVYIGIIRDGTFRWTAKSKVTQEAVSFKAFNWCYTQLSKGTLPPTLEVWHEGSCGRCGRRLTVPESIESGFGPECIQLI